MTTATATYKAISTVCRTHSDLGKSFGSFISAMNPKNATWPAYAITISVMAPHAVVNSVCFTAWTGAGGLVTARPIMQRKTALTMLVNAGLVSDSLEGRRVRPTDDRKLSYVVQRARHIPPEGDYHAYYAKHDRAGSMFGDGVHCHAEGEQMTRHQEETEEQLSGTDDLASDRPSDDFSRVCHVDNMWVACLELEDHVCGVAGEKAQHDQGDYSPVLSDWLRL